MKTIVIIGPESTGKSALAQALAAHFHCKWVPEYARTYLAALDRPYEQGDLAIMAEYQANNLLEIQTTGDDTMIIFDTDIEVLKVWSEEKYGMCAEQILRLIATAKVDYYLLMDIDIPWSYDPMREHPDVADRIRLFHQYYDIVLNARVPFALINGLGVERNNNAIKKIEDFLQSSI